MLGGSVTTDKFYINSRMGRIGATGASEQDPSETRAFGCQDLERDRLGRAVGSLVCSLATADIFPRVQTRLLVLPATVCDRV